MNVLILSLAYAPYSGVGVARMTSLSKYLIEKGCNVTVICYDCNIFNSREQQREIPEGVERIPVEKKQGKRENIRNLEKTVERIIKNKQFHLCISSVGPFETMFFINKLWRRWKLPYLIDYRDPWLFEKNAIKSKGLVRYKLFLYKCLCAPIERCAIKNAVKIVLVTGKCKEDIRKRYLIKKDKCRVIYNGYEDALGEGEKKEKNEFVIGIAGKLSAYNPLAADSFLAACKEVNNVHPVRVVHIGERDDLCERKYPEVYYNAGIKNHKDTMKILAESDALLICYAHENGLGTKVFDYIALNKPVIYAGTVPSELAEFLEGFEHSYICGDKWQMVNAVKELTQKCPDFLTKGNVEKYSRRQQNEIYWGLLKEICIEEAIL